MSDPEAAFIDVVAANIGGLREDEEMHRISLAWMERTLRHRYSYNFRWLGRPIIQYPQDIVAIQEVLWDVRPDLVVETGIAHGGSLILHASICQLLDHGSVLGIDIDIRPHNRAAIEDHPLAHRIELLEGSSIEPSIVERVTKRAEGKRTVVILDSNHTHDHVLDELHAYAGLVEVGSYCIVFDTVVEDLPSGRFPDRPWDVGNNPKTAVEAFLATDDRFEVDRDIEAKLQITVAPGGYLKRVR